MVRGIALLIFSVCMMPAHASITVWESARSEAHQITGKVVAIATDDDKMLVRIYDGKKTETYNVCNVYPGGDATVAENERAKSLREAFNHGDTIRASFNDAFDRCLSAVEITHETQPANDMKNKDEQKAASNKVSQK